MLKQPYRHPKAAIPSSIADDHDFSGLLFGYYEEDTQWYNILHGSVSGCNDKTLCIGFIMNDREIAESPHARNFFTYTRTLLDAAIQQYNLPELQHGHKLSINLPDEMKGGPLFAALETIPGILIGYHLDKKLRMFEIYGENSSENATITTVELSIDRH